MESAGITYGNAPAIGNLLSTSGPFAAGSWTEIDVTQWIGGIGQFEFRAGFYQQHGDQSQQSGRGESSGTSIGHLGHAASAAAHGRVTIAPIGDAYVAANNPTKNYGSSSQLRADASPDVRSYLRFNVQGLAGSIAQATLKIRAVSNSSTGYSVHAPSSSGWTELSVTYANAPSMGASVGESGAFASGDWTSVDVTSMVTQEGLVAVRINDEQQYGFRPGESRGRTSPPQLIVETTVAASASASPATSVVFPAEQYAQWRSEYGLSAGDEIHANDADQDGLQDAEEFSTVPIHTLATRMVMDCRIVGGGKWPKLNRCSARHQRRSRRPGR